MLLTLIASTPSSGMDFLAAVKMLFSIAILSVVVVVFALIAYVRGLDWSRARSRERSPE
jgi:hypothetical protein